MSQEQAESLKAMLRRVDWNSEESRHRFLCHFDSTFASFHEIDSYESIFQPDEIDRLLIDCIHCAYEGDNPQDARMRFIRFVIRIGYWDETEIEGAAQTIRRTTAIHHAAKLGYDDLVSELFEVYEQFEVNYSDESGLTHIHAASMSGTFGALFEFVQHKHDFNCCWTETGDTPLHLALDRQQDMVAALLMVACKAELVIPNAQGVIALELVVARKYGSELVEYLFKWSKDYMWKWAKKAFEFMAEFKLSLESCDIVLQHLTAEDLWNICVATNLLVTEFYAENADLIKEIENEGLINE